MNPASQPTGPLTDPVVRRAMRLAWDDSQADDPARRHEEGGYIVRNDDGSHGVVRWSGGLLSHITPPPRAADGSYQGRRVVGEFHTHPNPPVDERGAVWQESPSPGDIAGVQAEGYAGESYVISHTYRYGIASDGSTRIVGPRDDILKP